MSDQTKKEHRCDPMANLQGRDRMSRLADFVYEAGMLRKTPRSGYQFLGTGSENVAEHTFRAACIGFVLARLADADVGQTVMLCLVHDFHEARTGDFNYVNKIYNTAKERLAMEHALEGTGLEEPVLALWDEQDEGETIEARLAKDADQLDLIANLLEQGALGNPYAPKWLEAAVKRLSTEEGKALAEALQSTDHTDWWFKGPDKSWWEKKHQA